MKKAISSAIVTALVLGSVAPAAFAASNFSDVQGSYAKQAIEELAAKGILNGVDANHFNPEGTLSRAAFAKIIVLSLGLEATATTSSFSDVTGWAVPYVEAAKAAGLINGVGGGMFDPNGVVTREAAAKILVGALKTKVQLGDASDVTFTDANSISDWAKPFVAVAAKYNLIQGYDGKFDPQGSATRAQAAVLAQRLTSKVEDAAKEYAITPGTANLAVGKAQQFKVEGAKNVAWSADGGVIDQNGNFIASAPGNYTVTAVVDGIKTLTQKVSVYGAVSMLHIVAPSELVANGTSTKTVTVHAFDANNNIVGNFNGTVAVAVGANSGAALVDSTGAPVTTLTFVNGVATVLVKSNTVPGSVVTFTATGATLKDAAGNVVTGISDATAQMNSVAQVATAFKVTPSGKYLIANDNGTGSGANTASVSVDVVDQDGVSMLTGTYALKLSLTGPASFANVATPDQLSVTAGSPVSVVLNALKGQTGTVTLTASGSVGSATASLNAVVAQNVASLQVAPAVAGVTSFAEGSQAGVIFNVTGADVNGVPASVDFSGGNIKVFVTDKNGNTPANILVNGSAANIEGVALAAPGTITITDTNVGANAGAYTVVVKDTATTGALTAAPAFTVTETAATAYKFGVTSAASQVTPANAATTVTAQVTDAYGNPVTLTTPVTFLFTATNSTAGTGKSTLNGVDSATGVKVTTDATGKATVNFVAQPYAGASWTITAVDQATTAPLVTQSTTVDVKNSVVSTVKATVSNTSTQSLSSLATAGDTVKYTFTASDTQGNDVTASTTDNFKVTYDPSAIKDVGGTLNADGTKTLSGSLSSLNTTFNAVQVKKAGSVSVSISDVDVNATTGSASIWVNAGKQSGFGIIDSTGKPASALTVAANTPVAVTVKPVDAFGNVVSVSNAAYTVNLSDNPSTGQFRATADGASISSITFANGASSATVYYVNGTAGSYALSSQYSQILSTLSASVPANFTAGTAQDIPLSAKDQLGNGFNGTVSVTLSGSATAAPTTADDRVLTANVTFTDGLGTFTGAVLDKAGAGQVVASVGTVSSTAGDTTVAPNAIDAAQSTATIDKALAAGATSTVTAIAKDKYGNVLLGHTFYLDITVTNATTTTGESYTVDGKAYTATTADVALAGTTDANGVVTFAIAIPATVDAGDGVSVQVKTASAGSNVGSAFSFTQP